MRGLAGNGTTQGAEGLLSWWALAGVDTAVGQSPVNWLRQRVVPVDAPKSNEPLFPATLDTFHRWLADSRDLPDAGWNDGRILPTGEANPQLMVVCDMPDRDDNAANELLTGDAGKLFDAMLRAIGFTRSSIYLCALALSRPPGGLFEESAEAVLIDRMRHHIRLVDPKRVLMLGDRTSRALLSADAAVSAHGLVSLNHAGGTVDAIAIAHPRLLLLQPGAKTESWRALQYLIEGKN